MSALATSAQSAPRSEGAEDAELVRRVRRGDESAFETLYHRYHRRITAYIHGMVHDHARAEDVAQDVFVSALRRMRETERPIAFKPWIYEIAKNACIDQFRRSRRAEEVSYDADEGLGAADYGRLVSADAMPENELESKTNLDHLRGAFGGLSETHHEILVMRELEGLSYREIGERLGMSRPSVESTLFRARRRLTEEYEELVSGARCQRIQIIIADAAGTDLGARDQRRLARHVSHCQPCRRQARLAGLDVPVTGDRPVRARIAALLPLPLFLRRRWLGHDDAGAVSGSSSHVGSFAQWSSQLGSTVDPSWLKAAATAATIAVAGVGASSATHSTLRSTPAGGLSGLVSDLGGGDSGSTAAKRQAVVSSGSASGAAHAPSPSTSVTPARSTGGNAPGATNGTGGGSTGGQTAVSASPVQGVSPGGAASQAQQTASSTGGDVTSKASSSPVAVDPNAVTAPPAPNPPANPPVTPPDTSGAADTAAAAADTVTGPVGGLVGGN